LVRWRAGYVRAFLGGRVYPRLGNRQVRRKPYDRGRDPDDWGERAEWSAIIENDFEGWERSQLIDLIHSLARRLLDNAHHADAKIDAD
jgi:hypothetical protein